MGSIHVLKNLAKDAGRYVFSKTVQRPQFWREFATEVGILDVSMVFQANTLSGY